MQRITAILTFVLAFGGAAAAAADHAPAQIVVALVPVVSARVPPPQLAIAESESSRLWETYAVRIVWAEPMAACGQAPATDLCLRVLFQKTLRKRRTMRTAPPLGEVDFGADGRPMREIRLAYETIAEFVSQSDRRLGVDWPASIRNQVLGRALGRVVAHEVGHVVLGLPTHAAAGLMRKSFEPDEIGSPTAAAFSLTTFDIARLGFRAAWLRSVRTSTADSSATALNEPGTAARSTGHRDSLNTIN